MITGTATGCAAPQFKPVGGLSEVPGPCTPPTLDSLLAMQDNLLGELDSVTTHITNMLAPVTRPMEDVPFLDALMPEPPPPLALGSVAASNCRIQHVYSRISALIDHLAI